MKKFELYDELERLSDSGEILEISNAAYNTCRRLFSELGMGGKFDPTNPGRMLDTLYAFETTAGNNNKVTEALGEIEQELNPGEELEQADLGPKSMNSQDLKALLDDFDKHTELEELDKKVDAALKDPKFKRYGHNQISQWIRAKMDEQAKALARGLDPIEADNQSDQVLITKNKIEKLTRDENISEERLWKTAEKVVELAVETRTTEEALRVAGRDKDLDISTEWKDEVIRTVREAQASIRTNSRISGIAEKLVEELKGEGITLTPVEEKLIFDAARASIERVVFDPNRADINDPVVDITRGKPSVIRQPLTTDIIKVIGPSRTEDDIKATEIAVKKAGSAATNLWEADSSAVDTAGAKLSAMRNSFTDMHFDRQKYDALMAMRYASSNNPGDPKSVIDQERSVVVEERAIQEALKHGYTEEAVRQGKAESDGHKAAKEAGVVTALLKSPYPVKKNIEIVILHREELSKQEEFRPLVETATKLNRDPRLINSVEMIRKLVHWQDRLDKLTGGLISKTTGKVFEMSGFEGLKEFGVQLANRYGGEMVGAMATHIAQFGFEQGLRNILGQLLSTGTVTAVKAGTAAAGAATTAGAVAVDGAAAAAAGTGVGIPVALILLALQLAWTMGKSLLKNGEKALVKILETLGIGSAKNVADAKKLLGDMVKMGMVAGGVVVTTILSLPAMLAAAPMAMVGIVLVIVFSTLIGYNMLQTATTQISSQVSPKMDEGGGVCVKKSDIKGPSGGKLANCDTSKTGSVPGISQDAFVNLASRWSAGGGTNAARCYGAVVCAALAAGKDPTFVLWAWLHESGASNYSLGDIEDFGIHGQGPATNDFNAQIGSFLNLNPGYCHDQNGMDYWLGFATNYLTGTCDPNVAVGSNTGYTYLAEMQQTWSWVSGKPMPATANGSGGASCGGGGSSGDGDEEEGDGTEIDPNTGEEYMCFGGGTLTSGSGPGFPRGTGSPSRGPSSPYPTRDPNVTIPPGCPMGWPVEGNMPITQGSRGDHTHTNIPGVALDIMPTDASGNGSIGGTSIKVTHPGVVIYSGYSGGAYGNLVIVRGKCGNSNFVTYYAHLMDSQLVSMNQTMAMGQSVGLANNSGDYPVGNDHLHYEIRGCAGETGGCYGASGFDPHDYIPVDVPDGCFWNCNVNTGQK